MSKEMDRRSFLEAAALATAGLSAGRSAHVDAAFEPSQNKKLSKPFLTEAGDFVDVSRGSPKPFTLKGEALERARLTHKSWRLEIVGDETSEVAKPNKLEDNSALDLAGLMELGKSHGVRYLKAMQCNNIPAPLGQGLWEGVPLRDVLRRVGRVSNVRRVYYWGFHNNDPQQLFQSSMSYNRVMETPPWEPPPLVAYRLNGREIPLERGGPVRLIVPWAHGFKSIKWLQRIVLTNNYQANDTYALQNNDPESYLKTAAYLDRSTLNFRLGETARVEGVAVVGCSGLKRVEYWLRPSPASGEDKDLADDDPLWSTATWRSCEIMAPPENWSGILPQGTSTKQVWGFNADTGKPKDWPLLYSTIPWAVNLPNLATGSYEIRARTLDLNGFAQPEPRPYLKSGRNQVPRQKLVVST